MVYGETIRLPADFFVESSVTIDPSSFVEKLRRQMSILKPVPDKKHGSPKIFVNKELARSTHVFIRNDANHNSLQNPYEGPFRVISRTEKFFVLNFKGKNKAVSIDRLKPAFLLKDAKEIDNDVVNNDKVVKTKGILKDCKNHSAATTTRSGRRVHFTKNFFLG
ncbi:hypothetical protein RI129_013150 [Pyrocoelia pectoralis]|uniref:Uncharacterized protein n=1 Tax=Pyrocoelia pectoralis TaxID=417401 RepID=A0AAN7Z7F5_9COLE